MNLNQIEHFKTVCETRSITDAAERLFISRPSLSTSIRNLEKELGVILLQRDKRGVTPTKAGRILYDFALRYSNLYSECMSRISIIKQQGKVIRFGCAGGIVDPSLIARIYEYEKKVPGFSIEIINRDYPNFYSAVEHGRLDFALTVCPPPSTHLTGIQIREVQQHIIVNRNNPLARKNEVDFTNDLHGITLLETEGRFTPYLRILNSLDINRKMVGEDRNFIKQLIAHDKGCVITVESLLHRYVDSRSCVKRVVNIPSEIDLNPYLVFLPTVSQQTRAAINYVLMCFGSSERMEMREGL